MVDNVQLNSASTVGAVMATDDIGGVHYQIIKVSFGALDTQTAVTSAAPFPVGDGGGSLTVDGTVGVTSTSASPLVVTDAGNFNINSTSAAPLIITDAGNLNIAGTVTVDGSGVTQPVSGTVTANAGTGSFGVSSTSASAVVVTDAGNFNIAGTVTVDGSGVTQPISGSVDVSSTSAGPLVVTDAGNFNIAGTVTVDGSGVTQPVSGTVSVSSTSAGPIITTLVDTSGGSVMDNANDALRVNIVAGAAAGGTSNTDSGAFTSAAGAGTPAMGYASLGVVTSGDVGVLGMNVNRQLYVSIQEDAVGIGGGIQHQIDAVTSADATGTLLLATRDDTLTTLTPADGDYVQLRTNSLGALHVTGGGGGTEYNVNDAAPADPTGATFVMERDDALSTLTEIEGDWTQPRSNARGAQWVELDLTNDVTIADGGNSITVDGGVTVDNVSATPVIARLVDGNGTNITDDANDSLNVTIVSDGVGIGGGTQHAIDAVTSADAIGTLALATRDDVLTTATPADGDYVQFKTNEFGALWTCDHSLIDSNNSTTTPLGISAAFTGTGVDVSQFAVVTVTLFADQDSATDGMTFQFSTDNSNWDDVYSFTMTANETRRFQFPATAQFFRVVYTNGGTGQGAFRVQTILHPTYVGTSIHRISDTVDPDRSTTIVKSAIIAQAAGSGDFATVQATAGGNLKVAIEEFDASLPAGTNLIGEVTVSSTSASAVIVTDGGNFTLAANSGVDIGDVTVNNAAGAAAVNIQDGGNSITVDGTVDLGATDNAVLDQIEVNTSYGDNTGGGVEAGSLRVTLASDSTGLLSVDDNGGSLTVDNAALSQTGGGTEAAALRVTIANDSTGLVSVDDGGSTLSIDDGGGAITVDGTVGITSTSAAPLVITDAGNFTLAANSGVDIGDVTINNTSANPVVARGSITQGTAPGGVDRPFWMAGVSRSTVLPISTDSGDVTGIQTDVGGRIVITKSPREFVEKRRIVLSGSAETTLVTAASAGVFLDLSAITFSNNSATQKTVLIRDGSAATPIIEMTLDASAGGAHLPYPVEMPQGTAANAWTAEMDVSATSAVSITAVFVERA